MATGSVRDPGKLTLRWEMFFWHPTELSDEGNPVERAALLNSGFERITGSGQSVAVVVRDGATEVFSQTARGHVIALSRLPEGRLTVELTPSDKLLSGIPAGPHLDSKGGKFNKPHDVMFRPVAFEIDVNADGEVTAPTPDRLLPVRDAAPEPVDGQPARPAPGPHAYVFVETVRRKGRVVSQQIQVDWKPDWLSRIEPPLRPTRKDRESNGVREVVLHITDGPKIVGAIRKFLAPGKDGGIHYIVDMDGHVVKMVHERHGTFHAGFKKVHLAAWGEGETSAKVARTSVGIEHVAAPGDEWPEAQIEASLDLVRQLSRHFGLAQRDVIGHNDVIVLKSKRALPATTKPCPAGGLPWERYQRAGLSLAAKTTFDPPENIYGGVFETRAVLDASAPRDAIEELQRDLHRIGWWLPAQRGGKRRFGTFDEHTTAGVVRFQARFMARQKLKFAKGKVDPATARAIKQVIASLE
jgi:N-acetyl-anhydromuramyl-L-alanine amidase AmpD